MKLNSKKFLTHGILSSLVLLCTIPGFAGDGDVTAVLGDQPSVVTTSELPPSAEATLGAGSNISVDVSSLPVATSPSSYNAVGFLGNGNVNSVWAVDMGNGQIMAVKVPLNQYPSDLPGNLQAIPGTITPEGYGGLPSISGVEPITLGNIIDNRFGEPVQGVPVGPVLDGMNLNDITTALSNYNALGTPLPPNMPIITPEGLNNILTGPTNAVSDGNVLDDIHENNVFFTTDGQGGYLDNPVVSLSNKPDPSATTSNQFEDAYDMYTQADAAMNTQQDLINSGVLSGTPQPAAAPSFDNVPYNIQNAYTITDPIETAPSTAETTALDGTLEASETPTDLSTAVNNLFAEDPTLTSCTGQCGPMSQAYLDELGSDFPDLTQIVNVGDETVHAFLVDPSSGAIVDPTWKQWLSDPSAASGLPDVFVGDSQDLLNTLTAANNSTDLTIGAGSVLSPADLADEVYGVSADSPTTVSNMTVNNGLTSLDTSPSVDEMAAGADGLGVSEIPTLGLTSDLDLLGSASVLATGAGVALPLFQGLMDAVGPSSQVNAIAENSAFNQNCASDPNCANSDASGQLAYGLNNPSSITPDNGIYGNDAEPNTYSGSLNMFLDGNITEGENDLEGALNNTAFNAVYSLLTPSAGYSPDGSTYTGYSSDGSFSTTDQSDDSATGYNASTNQFFTSTPTNGMNTFTHEDGSVVIADPGTTTIGANPSDAGLLISVTSTASANDPVPYQMDPPPELPPQPVTTPPAVTLGNPGASEGGNDVNVNAGATDPSSSVSSSDSTQTNTNQTNTAQTNSNQNTNNSGNSSNPSSTTTASNTPSTSSESNPPSASTTSSSTSTTTTTSTASTYTGPSSVTTDGADGSSTTLNYSSTGAVTSGVTTYSNGSQTTYTTGTDNQQCQFNTSSSGCSTYSSSNCGSSAPAPCPTTSTTDDDSSTTTASSTTGSSTTTDDSSDQGSSSTTTTASSSSSSGSTDQTSTADDGTSATQTASTSTTQTTSDDGSVTASENEIADADETLVNALGPDYTFTGGADGNSPELDSGMGFQDTDASNYYQEEVTSGAGEDNQGTNLASTVADGD